MKKLTILFSMLVLSFGLKAQKDTTASVCIPYPVIKTIQTDLIIGDSAKAMLNITSLEVQLLKDKVFNKDNEIMNYKAASDNMKNQIKNLTEQLALHKGAYSTLEANFNQLSKTHKRSKVKNTLLQIGGIIGGAILVGEVIHYRNLYIKSM